MKIRLLSDLHLEFGKFKIPELDTDLDTVLVLAGDIHVGKRHRNWIERYLPKFKHIILVPGNHEYYHCVIDDLDQYWYEYDDNTPNFSYLANDKLEIENTVFYGCTLWADYDSRDPFVMLRVKERMNDFQCIKTRSIGSIVERKVLPQDLYDLHCKSTKFLLKELPDKGQEIDKKHIVITHHLPHAQSLDPKYIHQSTINHAYFTDLEYMMADCQIDYWLHGHTHSSNDYMCQGVNVLCNPRGYCPRELNVNFNPILTIDL